MQTQQGILHFFALYILKVPVTLPNLFAGIGVLLTNSCTYLRCVLNFIVFCQTRYKRQNFLTSFTTDLWSALISYKNEFVIKE